jgi:hypothetical protein
MMDQSTIWVNPAGRATVAMISSGALPKVAFQETTEPRLRYAQRGAARSMDQKRCDWDDAECRGKEDERRGACLASSTNVTGTRASSQLMDA